LRVQVGLRLHASGLKYLPFSRQKLVKIARNSKNSIDNIDPLLVKGHLGLRRGADPRVEDAELPAAEGQGHSSDGPEVDQRRDDRKEQFLRRHIHRNTN
jgi:hypothetical protein